MNENIKNKIKFFNSLNNSYNYKKSYNKILINNNVKVQDKINFWNKNTTKTILAFGRHKTDKFINNTVNKNIINKNIINKNIIDFKTDKSIIDQNKNIINTFLEKNSIKNSQVISDDNIKYQILSNSIFAVAKSGTVSLEISNANIPSIIIYKINIINYLIMKSLVKVKFVNIINIINNKEIIPELLQGE